MKKKRFIVFIFAGVGILFCIVGIVWFVFIRNESSMDRRIPVTATLYPIAFLAEQIGGDLVSVKTVVPPGIEPHDFDPSLRDIEDMYRSRLVLISGAGIDRWAERLEGDFQARGVKVLILSGSVHAMPTVEPETGGNMSTLPTDPHFWLDPIEYQRSAEAVLQELMRIDPSHASVYRSNFDRFREQIDSLDAHLREFSGGRCRIDTVVVSHDAFSYLARRYGFRTYALAGINPEQEVSAGELAMAVRLMREKGIRYVLSEPFGNTNTVHAIGKEVSAEVLILNPIEAISADTLGMEENYFTLMNENWRTLRKALECE